MFFGGYKFMFYGVAVILLQVKSEKTEAILPE